MEIIEIQWHISVVIVRIHRAIGGVSHEHSRHGSFTLILSPTFSVILPYLQVYSDFAAPLPASITSSSRAIWEKNFNNWNKTVTKREKTTLQMTKSTNGIWIRRGSRGHHWNRRECSPIVNSLIDAIQCHIQRVCNLGFVRHLCYCWNFRRIGICSTVISVNKSNCLGQIRDHRSNSVVSYRLLLCHIQYWWHNSCQLWIDMHSPVLVALLLRHTHQICKKNQIHHRHHRMNILKWNYRFNIINRSNQSS